MTQKGQRNNRSSLFEQSMKIVVNVIKASSLSLAEISLGLSDVPPPDRRGSMMTLGTKGLESQLQPLDPGRQESKEPGSDSEVLSYLIEQGNGPRSLRVVEEDVNGRAMDFISRVHKGFKKVD